MATARLKVTDFRAHRYRGEPANKLPDWIRDFHIRKGADVAGVYREPLTDRLFLPSHDAPGHRYARDNDWIVMESGELRTYKKSDFERKFELVAFEAGE